MECTEGVRVGKVVDAKWPRSVLAELGLAGGFQDGRIVRP